MLAVVQGLEEVIGELESKVVTLGVKADERGWKQGYLVGQRDAYQSVLDKLREICL